MQKQADIWKPALISGALFGFLSGVPFLGALNIFCCCLFMGAGVMSSYMVIKNSLEMVSYGRAALTGFVAGIFGVPTLILTNTLFAVLLGQNMDAEIQDAFDRFSSMSGEGPEMMESIGVAVVLAMVFLFLAVLFLGFGTLGGVIGRAIFEKRTAPPPTAPVPGAGPIEPGSSPPPAPHS